MSSPTPGRFQRSWLLFRTSLQVVQQNKKLLLFPIVTTLFSLVTVLFFVAPALLYPTGHSLQEAAHWETLGQTFGVGLDADGQELSPTGYFYGYLAVLYLVSMFLATFFQTAFYSEILKALAGQPVSVRSGLRFACSRVTSILAWSLLAGLVGLIIKTLEERFGWIGRWVMRFVGVVWSVASVFAIPVIIREGGTNPLAMLRQSAATLRKTWGESLIGYVGVTVGTWAVLLASLILLGTAGLLSAVFETPFVIIPVVLVWLLAMFILSYLVSVASHVYRCALFVYATEGAVPGPFTRELMDAAWKVKKA